MKCVVVMLLSFTTECKIQEHETTYLVLSFFSNVEYAYLRSFFFGIGRLYTMRKHVCCNHKYSSFTLFFAICSHLFLAIVGIWSLCSHLIHCLVWFFSLFFSFFYHFVLLAVSLRRRTKCFISRPFSACC